MLTVIHPGCWLGEVFRESAGCQRSSLEPLSFQGRSTPRVLNRHREGTTNEQWCAGHSHFSPTARRVEYFRGARIYTTAGKVSTS